MNLRHLDLNLLLMLDALLQEGSVSQAAQRLGVSQPTLSAGLAKLRTLFNDELFVKNAKGMSPTVRALALREPLSRVMFAIQDEILSQPVFDPATSTRTFTLVFGELGQIAFVPRLLKCLRAAAPGVNLRVLGGALESRENILERGEADLAVGLHPELSASALFRQKLYPSRPLVCLASADHPELQDGPLTLELFTRLNHAVVGTDLGYAKIVEPVLKQMGIERRVVLELSNLSGTPHVLAGSDLITVVPEALARIYTRDGTLRMHTSPIEFPLFDVRQFWHRKVHHDPAIVWLRQLIAAEFQSLDPMSLPDAAAEVPPDAAQGAATPTPQ